MIASQRRVYIIDSLNRKGIISLKEIARELGISEITVRRDFEKLEQDGKLKRVQGGATRADGIDSLLESAELTMREKISLNLDGKTRVAVRAAQFVHDGDCIFLDGGTTMVPLMEQLAGRHIRVVTYSDLLVRKLKRPVAELFVVGGRYLPHYSMYVGPIAQEVLGRFSFDHAFLGCSGIDLAEGGVFSTELESTAMKKLAMEHARESHLLLDASKLDARGFVKYAQLEEFAHVISTAPNTVGELPQNFITAQ